MNKVRRQSNRKQWMGHVSAWRQSGLTQSAYCRVHGLVLGTFNAWISRERKTTEGRSAPMTLVPVVVQTNAKDAQLNLPLSLQHARGWQLYLPSGTPAKWLGEVLNELS